MTEYITPTTWEQCARHVPGESAAPYPHTVTPEVPDGYEAVWLPSETVAFGLIGGTLLAAAGYAWTGRQ